MVTLDIDKVEVQDPEGTNVTCDVSEEMAKRWLRGIYWRGHLLMYPDSATGQYGQDFDNYPKNFPEWIDRSPNAKANGVIAGTNGSGGFWPHMEIHLKDGKITEVNFHRSEETRLNSSHLGISYAVFCMNKKID